MCAWQSGGGSASPSELAYAEQTTRQVIAVANSSAIAGLAFTATIPAGTKFCLEFYCSEVDEDSGSTAGDLVRITLVNGSSHVFASGNVYQAAGGVGSALFIRSGTLAADGTAVTYSALVTNISDTASGAILGIGVNDPMYIRAVQLG